MHVMHKGLLINKSCAAASPGSTCAWPQLDAQRKVIKNTSRADICQATWTVHKRPRVHTRICNVNAAQPGVTPVLSLLRRRAPAARPEAWAVQARPRARPRPRRPQGRHPRAPSPAARRTCGSACPWTLCCWLVRRPWLLQHQAQGTPLAEDDRHGKGSHTGSAKVPLLGAGGAAAHHWSSHSEICCGEDARTGVAAAAAARSAAAAALPGATPAVCRSTWPRKTSGWSRNG